MVSSAEIDLKTGFIIFFFHPDFTVGFGIAPNQGYENIRCRLRLAPLLPVRNFTSP